MRIQPTNSARRHRQQAGIIGAVCAVAAAATALAGMPAVAVTETPGMRSALVRHVSARMPVVGPSRALSALRPSTATPPLGQLTPQGPAKNTWNLMATLPGAVAHDVDFPTPQIGFAAAELGQVWKTKDGGRTWAKVLNRGFPYYYYGVAALSRQDIVVSGFNNSTSEGIITWSHDGGKTWLPDEVLSSNAWIGRIRMPVGQGLGLAMNGGGSSGSDPNAAWFSDRPDKWHHVVPDPDGGWFGNQFTLLPNHHAFASGITFCKSEKAGRLWACSPSVDEVFDGPTAFLDDQFGWVGGGEISPDVAGWLHRTRSGGSRWSDRVLETPWPIRQLQFLTPDIGWAAGGDIYSGVGGISFTADGGKTWSLDLGTTNEVGACSARADSGDPHTRVWCLGSSFDGSQFVTTVYRTTVATP